MQPGGGDVLQFLKSGIMEIPDVLVVTKADLGQVAQRSRRDLNAALRSLGARDTKVLAVSSVAPATGFDELVAALDEHRASLDIAARRIASRRASALADFVAEHGERGLRALGGRRARAEAARRAGPGARRAGAHPGARAGGGAVTRSGDRAGADGRRLRRGDVVAELAGAANLGTAMSFGQIGFALAVVYVVVRR